MVPKGQHNTVGVCFVELVRMVVRVCVGVRACVCLCVCFYLSSSCSPANVLFAYVSSSSPLTAVMAVKCSSAKYILTISVTLAGDDNLFELRTYFSSENMPVRRWCTEW